MKVCLAFLLIINFLSCSEKYRLINKDYLAFDNETKVSFTNYKRSRFTLDSLLDSEIEDSIFYSYIDDLEYLIPYDPNVNILLAISSCYANDSTHFNQAIDSLKKYNHLKIQYLNYWPKECDKYLSYVWLLHNDSLKLNNNKVDSIVFELNEIFV